MKKLIGITVFLAILYTLLLLSNEGARSVYNQYNLGARLGLYGILSMAAGLLIITGGIDLSMGSVVGLSATVLAMLLIVYQWHPAAAIGAVLVMGMVIGLINGLLVTKLRVQAFVVTLCGLFIYRGVARFVAGDSQKGLGTELKDLKEFLVGEHFGLPMTLIIFLALMLAAGVFLHFSVYGRYFYAIGSNEKAARFSGIATDRYKVGAYVLCSTLTAFFAVLYLMENNLAQPSSTGNFFELYGIAGAVLGGCSLRGGQGSVVGIAIGSAILWILPNFANMWDVPSTLEYTVIGGALLVGALLYELFRPKVARGD